MVQQQDNFVQIRNLRFSHGERVIFDDVNFDIKRGKITAIMGPSGSGKTTLLRLIGGQLTPDSGEVLVNGVNIHRLSWKRLYKLRQLMGMMFQKGGLFTNLTVFENVAFPMREHTPLPDDMIRDLVLMKLQSVGLRGARNLMPAQLSGGMERRVTMARAMALDPKLLMYDEPFTGQDPITMAVLVQLIKRLNDALGLTSIIVSHDVPETASIADYLYLIYDGKVIAKGTSQEVLADQTPQVRQFIHGIADGVIPFHYPAVDYATDLML